MSGALVPGSACDKVLVAAGLLIDARNQLDGDLTPEERREFQNARRSLGVLLFVLEKSARRRSFRVIAGGGAS